MKLIKPKFWGGKIGIISILLFPLSLIFIFLVLLKKLLIKPKEFKIPIICVGNVYIGGTGKTPISIFLANELKLIGKKPVILRKYYKNHDDEYNLIKEYFKDLIICKNRISGLKQVENTKYDLAILDDGLQDYKIKKNINIVCFNQNQLIGNGMVLPSGPLRESLSVLKDVDIVIINGEKNEIFENKILDINKNLEIFYSNYVPVNIDLFKNKKFIAIAGIGNPENFFKLMRENNLDIQKKIIFPDHYVFSSDEIRKIAIVAKSNNFNIIMTEKDYLRVKNLREFEIYYLKVNLEIKNKTKLINTIKKLYDKNN